MNTTVAQNKAHRNDPKWTKTAASHDYASRHFTSGYETFDGWSIRKGWEMTGSDWHIYNPAGEHVGRAHSLTWAKYHATELGA